MNRLASRPGVKAAACFSVSLVLALFACRARAQDLDGVSFAGTVADQNGAVLPGANVTATLTETNSTRAAVADGEGRYRLFKLPPGLYSLRAERAGFAAEERKGIAVVFGWAGLLVAAAFLAALNWRSRDFNLKKQRRQVRLVDVPKGKPAVATTAATEG